MKKKKTIDLKSLWERSAKSQKIASTTVPKPLTIESEVQISQNVPSNPIQLLLEAPSAHDSDTSPSVQVEKEETNPSTQPDRAASPATGPRTESSPLSPISDDGDDDDDGIYDVDLLPRDPAHRTPISSYDVNKQDAVRRGFVALGPFQPDHEFPQRDIGGKRRFNARWFNEYKWLEYSVELDAAFCFVCYLFKDQTSLSSHGGDAFVNEGFRNWNMKWRFDRHVGSINSGHNQAQEKYELFISGKQSIRESCASNTEIYKEQYKSRLTYSLKCLRFLLRQGLACRGHDESDDSHNRGNFLELLNWLAQNFEEVNKVVLINAPKNCKMTCPTIQKEIINCCAKATTSLIMQELGDGCFAILADESSDVYQQEQLALCLRYVDKKGRVVERFLGIVQVENTSSLTLKSAIESLLASQSLSFSRVRGQGYDGASNMKGHVNGLKKLIMDECPSAYYVHCFAHQLQLTLVAVAKENSDCVWFFEQLRYLLTVIGNSCKKTHMLRVAQARRIVEALDVGDIETGTGLNQEMGLSRPGDTRWGSHYKTVMHVISLYPSIRQVLFKVGKDKSQNAEAIQAQTMLESFESFEFIFMAHLLLTIFGYSDDLSNALQKRDQDIVNAIELIYDTKMQLQLLREDDGWESFLKDVTSFCAKHGIKVVDMDGFYKPVGRSKRFFKKVKNFSRFHVDMFISIIDRQLQELNDRFDEVNTELLLCMASFNPIDSFSAYDKENLVKLAQFYPKDFTETELLHLPFQLTLFINFVRRDERFKNVKNLVELSTMLVATKKHTAYELVYKLLKLVLILPVATASVERVFSSMNYVKNKLRNRMGEQYLNDCLVTFLERDLFVQVTNDDIISRFQAMATRKVKL